MESFSDKLKSIPPLYAAVQKNLATKTELWLTGKKEAGQIHVQPHGVVESKIAMFYDLVLWVFENYDQNSTEFRRAKFFEPRLRKWLTEGVYEAQYPKEVTLAYHFVNSGEVCRMINERKENYKTPKAVEDLFISEWNEVLERFSEYEADDRFSPLRNGDFF
jgi:hypothetical protein